MAEQLLDSADVVTVLQQVRGERMPERVTARVLNDAGLAQRALDGTLDDGLVQVMAAALAGEAVHVVSGRREHPLPAELASGVRVFPRQRVGHGDPAGAGLEVHAMLPAYRLDLRSSRVFAAVGSMVTRSLAPLPLRTTSRLAAKSTSLMRNCAHSSSRRPAP